MNESHQKVHEISDGDIGVWIAPGGAICIKACTEFSDPVELSEKEALALADVLTKLVDELR